MVAGAHGDAALVQQGADVVRVRAVHDEGHQRRLRGVRREHAHPGQALQAVQGLGAQRLHMAGDGGGAELGDELRRRGQAHGARHMGRAAFQARGQGGEAGVLPAHPVHHVAPQAQGVQALERAAPAGQHARAHGAVHLVAREGQEVAVQLRQLRRAMAHGLGGVEHGERTGLRGQAEQVLIGRALARGVGAGGEGEHARARRQQALERLRVHAPLRIGQQDAQLCPGHARRLLPGDEVGVVFQAADDDLVARAQPGAARPARPQALGHEVERLGGARGEHQCVRGSGADEALERGARRLEGVGGALAQGVYAAVDVGAVAGFEVPHGLQHAQRHVRGGGVVQVG